METMVDTILIEAEEDPRDELAQRIREIITKCYFNRADSPEVVVVIHPSSNSYPDNVQAKEMLNGIFEGSITYPCSKRQFNNMMEDIDDELVKLSQNHNKPQIAILYDSATYLYEVD